MVDFAASTIVFVIMLNSDEFPVCCAIPPSYFVVISPVYVQQLVATRGALPTAVDGGSGKAKCMPCKHGGIASGSLSLSETVVLE